MAAYWDLGQLLQLKRAVDTQRELAKEAMRKAREADDAFANAVARKAYQEMSRQTGIIERLLEQRQETSDA
jgi:hypothetical protein